MGQSREMKDWMTRREGSAGGPAAHLRGVVALGARGVPDARGDDGAGRGQGGDGARGAHLRDRDEIGLDRS